MFQGEQGEVPGPDSERSTLIALALPERQIAVARTAVLGRLREEGLYSPNLIYRGFSQHLVHQVLEYGSEGQNSHYMYGNNESALSIDPDPRWENPLSYALLGHALAIYRGDYLIPEDYTTYRFSDLATKRYALKVVFTL